MPDSGPLLTLDRVRAAIRELDPTCTRSHRLYETALFMMAAYKGVGQSDVALARFTGLSRGFLIRRIRNLRAQGVWGEGAFNHGWHGDGGVYEFRLDLKAAEGELEAETGEPILGPSEVDPVQPD